MDCRHYWQYAGSLDRAVCARCGAQARRDEPDPDGAWHDRLPVAFGRALRARQYPVKWPSKTQAAPALA